MPPVAATESSCRFVCWHTDVVSFHHLYWYFQRLLLSPSADDSINNLQYLASSSGLANALIALSGVSWGCILHAAFPGGVDCAWIAAFSEWILILDIEIMILNAGKYTHLG